MARVMGQEWKSAGQRPSHVCPSVPVKYRGVQAELNLRTATF